nr:MAG TPA: hypothetical protein [Caudoviricetes sp.]
MTKKVKESIQDRKNRDKLIVEHRYSAPKTHRRGR